MKILTIILGFICIVLSYSTTCAFDDRVTHPQLTDIAIKNSVLKNNYLSKNLGNEFSKDYESVINGRKVIEWLTKGSTDEDTPNCRAANHFHNPLLSWNERKRGQADRLLFQYLIF